MTGTIWTKFFWSDWESDEGLRQCSLGAQGLWMRMLCVCAKGDPLGYFAINGKPLGMSAIEKIAGIDETTAKTLVQELEDWGVFSRDRKGCIYSRRMIRDKKRSEEGKKHVEKRWRQHTEIKEENSLPNRGATTPMEEATCHKPESREEKKDLSTERSKESSTSFDLTLPDNLDLSGFPAWWRLYPRKVGKRKAEALYRGIVRRKEAAVEQLAAGLQAAVAYWRAEAKSTEFIPHPTTWLNRGGWADDYTTIKRASTYDIVKGRALNGVHDGDGGSSAVDGAGEADQPRPPALPSS